MGGLWNKLKSGSKKAIDYTAKGVKRLDEAGRENAPAIKRGAKGAAKTGLKALDLITKAGNNVNKNIDRGYGKSNGSLFGLDVAAPKNNTKRKRKKGKKGKRKVVIYV